MNDNVGKNGKSNSIVTFFISACLLIIGYLIFSNKTSDKNQAKIIEKLMEDNNKNMEYITEANKQMLLTNKNLSDQLPKITSQIEKINNSIEETNDSIKEMKGFMNFMLTGNIMVLKQERDNEGNEIYVPVSPKPQGVK